MAFEPDDTGAFGVIAQILGDETRIEMQRVTQAGDRTRDLRVGKSEFARLAECRLRRGPDASNGERDAG
jgi:hypothetical protein